MDSNAPRRVIAIGQFPPPFNGFSMVSQAMVAAVATQREVITVNTAAAGTGPRWQHYLRRLGLLAAALARLLRERLHGPATLYLPCEGDAGLLLTLLLVLTGRALGFPTVVHHHSFGYITTPSNWMRWVVRAGGSRLAHVFLCPRMESAYAAVYGRVQRSWTQSNAVFVPLPASTAPTRLSALPASAAPAREDRRGLVIGHLSNLTREKGLHTFLELFHAARAHGLPVSGLLAGPALDAADVAAIGRTCAEFPADFEYLGAVMGARKEAFYRRIDVFVFPSQYANEAQPVVLFEARAYGALIASTLRGCIAGQLGDDALAVASAADFVPRTLNWLEAILQAAPALEGRRSAVAAAFRSARARAETELHQLAASL